MERDDTEERWRPIPGWEGMYSVSDRGRVRSEARMVSTGHTWLRPVRTRILKELTSPSGYLHVKLPDGGVFRPHRIHVLVLLAFVGPRPPRMQACHHDGDKTNNRLSNLRWGTPASNVADCVRHGKRGYGELGPRAKLTNRQAAEIRSSSATARVLAGRFNVSREVIKNIRSGRTYPQASHQAGT